MNESKIINDPVHGFITIPGGLILDLLANPVIQRLREIKQLGMTNLVYPGATHTRLSHTLGAMYLMNEAVVTLRSKEIEVSDQEQEAVMAAILMHDIGHSPFSHALEEVLVEGVSHETISLELMKKLNRQLGGKLDMAIEIFRDNYSKHFLHQLVSGQLDVDRLDYLTRDSFFSGVAEGVIGEERIIKTLNVHKNNLVVEQKGAYSVEKFLMSRRHMYWQVYLHKTVIAASNLLVMILKRAKELMNNGHNLPGSKSLLWMLTFKPEKENLNDEFLNNFIRIDDSDIISALKDWQNYDDKVLAKLCEMLVDRNLPKIEISETPFAKEYVERELSLFMKKYKYFNAKESDYFVNSSTVENRAYKAGNEEIGVLFKDGSVKDIYLVSDVLNSRAFSQITKKYFLCKAI